MDGEYAGHTNGSLPLLYQTLKRWMTAQMGKLGGLAVTDAKAAAVRENGIGTRRGLDYAASCFCMKTLSGSSAYPPNGPRR